jgi:arylsulfatase A-like enzyme
MRLGRIPWVALAVVLIGAAAWLAWPRGPRPRGGVDELDALAARSDVNVLFVLIDTLRADRLGVYGYERDTSPHLDALARDGIRFAHVRSQSSWTKCSMASLWTGLYPAGTGVLRIPDGLPEAARLPAQVLSEAGFRTVGLWRNGWVHPRFGFGRGFDLYVQVTPDQRPTGLEPGVATAHPLPGSDRDVMRSAVEFLRDARRDRWLLYLHLMDVHQYAFDEDSARFGTRYSDSYDNAIRWVDKNVGALLGELDRLGLRDRTLVIVAADHGEAFDEHGREGHARDLYAEVTTTPWIVSLPFRLSRGWVVETPVANVDLWPTVLDLLGLPSLGGTDGRSLLPELRATARGGPTPGPATRFAQLDLTWGRGTLEPDPLITVTDGGWRLLHRPRRPAADQLYDLRSDPAEQRDRSGDAPDELARLRRAAAAQVERRPAWGPTPRVELEGSEVVRLRALGYAVED